MKPCSVCGQKTAGVYKQGVKSVYSDKAYDLMHCTECDHYFTYPLPKAKELDNIYINKYSYDAHALIEDEKRMRARKYANFIARRNVKSALEVGCMHGLLLTELQKLGVKVAGVELDPEAVEYCKQRGLNVVQSSIEDHLSKATQKHDVIIMSHVLEHIVDPKTQLKNLSKRIPKNGQLVLIVPNSQSATRKLFGKYWGYWQVPVHINHFNKKSVRTLLEDTGFAITDIKFYGADSLFFLSTLANLLGARNDTKDLTGPKKLLVKIATIVLRPWYFIGSEDMLVVASKK